MKQGLWNLIAVVFCLTAVTQEFAFASEKWTVKGKIMVQHVLPELTQVFGGNGGVAGITVKVSARSKIPLGWGTWNSWGKLPTRTDGSFEVSEKHASDRRQFKVEILFDSDKLRIKEGQETAIIKFDSKGFPLDLDFDLTDKDWHEVHNDKDGPADDGRKAGVINLGDIFIKRTVVKKHADVWMLYHKVFNAFAGYGSEYAFKKKVALKYPMKLGSISYANPLNNNLYIDEHWFDSNTLIHELMHVWVYERSTGEDSMVWQAIKHGHTHQDRENTTLVAFQEGFTEWSTYKILKEITDGKVTQFDSYLYKYPDHPLTRNYIGEALGNDERVLANVDYTERGWHSLFNILTFPYLDRVDFNKPLTVIGTSGKVETHEKFAFVSLFTSCADKRLGYTLKDILGVFLKYPTKGITAYMGTRDMNFRNFLDRAGAILAGFEKEKIKQVKLYLSPNRVDNPCT